MAQWGFVGPSYQAAALGQDNELCINWYPELSTNQPSKAAPDLSASKTVSALLSVPGLQVLYSGLPNEEVRGMWPLPGNTKALLIVGSVAVLMAVTGTSATGVPSFSYTTLGFLGTSTGHVGIRDNGAAHIVVVVDGTSTFYTFNTQTSAWAAKTDANFPGASMVAEIDGWFVFNQPGTQKFFTAPNYWNGSTAFDGTYFALKDNSSDNLVAVIETNRELWLLGESTTEPWYNAGGANFPFSRINGAMMQIGCAAANSVARTGKGLIWLARSERGENSIITTQGYQYTVVSTPAISYALNQFPLVSDAIGWIYTEEGHEFYVLTFPTANVTYVYDLTTGLWHQRASFNPATGKFNRIRIGACMNFAGMRIVGDCLLGYIYQQSRKFFQDGIYPLVAVRRTPHVWDKDNRNRVVNTRLQLDFLSGVGLQSGQGSDPQAMLRWSNDSGQTWGSEHWTSMGKAGQTRHRAIWRRLGAARDRVYEVRVTDPVPRDIVGASLVSAATAA